MNTVLHTPMVAYTADGAIKPNMLFHRAWNKIHSRCIEYPFAASSIQEYENILDIGSAHGSGLWLQYLGSLNAHVCVTDHDPLPFPIQGIAYVQGDCRKLPLPDSSFDRIIAVSVLEHIGLLRAQCAKNAPHFDPDGDRAALQEWWRLLRPEGELVLTCPFGVQGGFSPDGTARRYIEKDLRNMGPLFSPLRLDYYEYQFRQHVAYYDEARPILPGEVAECPLYADMAGSATWRRIPRENARARNENNMDGLLCSVWRKEER